MKSIPAASRGAAGFDMATPVATVAALSLALLIMPKGMFESDPLFSFFQLWF
ncbi:hypothetical protein HanRHA438_Chr01g0019181 [Helianthus annuus]|nr:hypothetical protein HanRHA438_Chr01g0019181 [Helianthus annuus]